MIEPEVRCQWSGPSGQCPKPVSLGSNFCDQHAAPSKTAMSKYLITCKLLGDAPDRHVAAAEMKSLREEIALTRAMIEKRLNMIESEAEYVAAMPVVQSFLGTVEKLVTSCHNMEVKLGTLLSKAALINLAQKMIQIIDANLRDVEGRNEIVEKVGQEIVTAIAEQEN